MSENTKRRLEWTPFARAAYEASIAYIAEDDPITAQSVQTRAAKSLELLATQPGMGTPGKLAGRRVYPIPRIGYSINYRVTADAIIIDRWYRQRQNVAR